jgi:hypothetical protein
MLDSILEQIAKTWQTPQDDIWFDPFMRIVKNQKMGHSTNKQSG